MCGMVKNDLFATEKGFCLNSNKHSVNIMCHAATEKARFLKLNIRF